MNDYLLCGLLAGFIIGGMFAGGLSEASGFYARWRQHRFVAKLLREGRARYDEQSQIKARVLVAGHVIEFADAVGAAPNGRFALCECWRFDPSNGSLGYTEDSKGVIRMFGYTKAEIIYVAEHASEFVGVAPLP